MPRLHAIVAYLRCLLLCVAASAVGGCNDAGTPPNHTKGEDAPRAYPYKITTTVGMITDIVREVAGDKAVVTGIMAEGIDPHLYKPTRGDVLKLQEADIVFYNGLLLEGKMTEVLEQASKKRPVVAVTRELEEGKYIMSAAQGHHDPHVWMDVRGWIHAVEAVAESLSSFDPRNASDYRKNADAYVAQLEQLDTYVKQVIASIPEQQRVLVTAHDAFGYFGRAYHINVMGIQGISTESEAGIKRVNELVDFLVKNRIKAIFVETSVSEKNVTALLEGAKANGADIKIGGTLYSDAMGAAGTYDGTYIGMIDHNASTIAHALGGTVPEGGFRATLKQ